MLQNRCKSSGIFLFGGRRQAGNILFVDVAVDICSGGDAGVSHQVLRGFEIIPLPPEVGAVSVAQKMRRDRGIEGVLNDLIAVEFRACFTVAGTVEAGPHPAQMRERQHFTVPPVDEIAAGLIEPGEQLGRHGYQPFACRGFRALFLRLVPFGVGRRAADPEQCAVLAQVGLADRHGLAAAQAAVQHEQHPRPRPMPGGDLADERFFLAGQRAARGFAGRGILDAAAGCDLDQTVDFGLLEQLPQGVEDLPHGTLGKRFAVLPAGIVDELLEMERPHGSHRHKADHRQDMPLEVDLVVDALARADLRLLIGVVPLPCPLLDGQRLADDLHALGVQVLVVAHFLLKDRLVILTDVFADRLAVRLVPDGDRLDVFVGVGFLGSCRHADGLL